MDRGQKASGSPVEGGSDRSTHSVQLRPDPIWPTASPAWPGNHRATAKRVRNKASVPAHSLVPGSERGRLRRPFRRRPAIGLVVAFTA